MAITNIPGKRPNILIFCTDEQRGDHLGCMGHQDLKTPNIDRIASEGTLFRYCYSSNPVCMPARATIKTESSDAQALAGVYMEAVGDVAMADKYFAKAGADTYEKFVKLFE